MHCAKMIVLIACLTTFYSINAQTKKDESENQIQIGAYYYPWYSNGALSRVTQRDWMSQALRGRLKPRQMPKLGTYNSRDEKVIADHITQSVRGNIAFWAVSWWGPNSKSDVTFREHILKHEDVSKLKYAILYESTGRLGSFDNPNYQNLLPDFEFMSKNLWNRGDYLKINGKPVVFIYLSRVYFRNRGIEPWQALRAKFPQVYLVGDDVFGGRYQPQHAKLWDAITAYDVYGQSLQIDGATRSAIARLQRHYQNAKSIANSVDTGFIPAVSPGFNDRAVRRGHAGRGRMFTDVPDSKPGDIFRSMIHDVAIPLVDNRCDRIFMVTSFNEWYEDTQIEATTGTEESTSVDDSKSGRYYTQGDTYFDYGYLYLDILKSAKQSASGAHKEFRRE